MRIGRYHHLAKQDMSALITSKQDNCNRMSQVLVALPRCITDEIDESNQDQEAQSSVHNTTRCRSSDSASSPPLTFSPLDMPDGRIHFTAHLRYPLDANDMSLAEQHLKVWHNPFHPCFNNKSEQQVPKMYQAGNEDLLRHINHTILLTLAHMYGRVIEEQHDEQVHSNFEEEAQYHLFVSGYLTEKAEIEIDWLEWC